MNAPVEQLYLYTPKPYWGFNVTDIEARRKCKFVGEFCVKDQRGNWTEEPLAIFWQEIPPVPGYSHYFAVRISHFDNQVYISSGASVEGLRMTGIVADNGEVIYSRYRHDFVYSTDRTVFVDGGRDYVKSSMHGRRVTIVLHGPDLIIEEFQEDPEL
jgi:hypothetical protein